MKLPNMKLPNISLPNISLPIISLKSYHLFFMLLLALILCSCFGGNMREGYSSNTYSGPEGNQATVYTGANGRKAVGKDGSIYYLSLIHI